MILKELHKIAAEFESFNPHGSLGEFISHLSLMGEFDIELEEGYEFENAVRVTTIHQSKGKEYPVVFIADVAINKLPLRYQAKKFYVPSELSKGVKIAEDEKALYIQEERRLLYVAMTRAQNLLFISYAKQYGENKRESAPSRFLEEINFDQNQLIQMKDIISDNAESQSFLVEDNKIERLRNDLQLKAMRSICEMNLKTAIDRIIDLAKIRYFEENNSVEGFDPIECRKIDYDCNTLDNELKGIHNPLINKEKLKLSVSKLETYTDCPLKFKFAHVLEIPSPSKSFFDLGTSVHAVAEHLTQLEIDGIKITEEIAFEILDKEWITSSFKSETEANQAKEKAKEMIKTYLKWKSINPNPVLAAEQKFTIEINDIPFNGSIDRIEKTPEGDFEVIDFKTGGIYESKKSIKDNIQMNVYALATQRLYEKLPKTTSLFYLKKDKTITNKIESSQVEKVKKTIEEKVDSIVKEEFTATPSYEVCRKCDYQMICDSRKIR